MAKVEVIKSEKVSKKIKSNDLKNESKQNNNKTNITNTKELQKKQNSQQSNNKTTDTNSSNSGIGGVIVFIGICIAIVWVLNKTGFFRIFDSSSTIGTWYNEAGTILKVKKDGTCEVNFSETDYNVTKYKQHYDFGDVIVTKCEWKKDFNEDKMASVTVTMKYGTLEFTDTLIQNTWVHSNDWGGFKRK